MSGPARVAEVGAGSGQAGAGLCCSGFGSRAGRIHAISTAAGRRHGSGFIAPCTGAARTVVRATLYAVARVTLYAVARDFVRSG
jgi:hypothetical protein